MSARFSRLNTVVQHIATTYHEGEVIPDTPEGHQAVARWESVETAALALEVPVMDLAHRVCHYRLLHYHYRKPPAYKPVRRNLPKPTIHHHDYS